MQTKLLYFCYFIGKFVDMLVCTKLSKALKHALVKHISTWVYINHNTKPLFAQTIGVKDDDFCANLTLTYGKLWYVLTLSHTPAQQLQFESHKSWETVRKMSHHFEL
jgi:hypothetical protein